MKRFSDNPLAQRLRARVRFVHAGEEGGLAGQLIAAVASAGACLHVWTGLSLAARLRAARGAANARDPSAELAPARHALRRGLGAGTTMLALLAAGSVTRVAADESQAPAFKPPTFADDTLMYVLGPSYRNPFTTSPSQAGGADISRNTVELKHLDAWKFGHNVVEIAIKKSNEVEPAAGGGTGALGLYAIFRSGIGINRVAGRPIVAKGPLRDVDVQAGMNLETKNSDFAPQERTLYFGPNLQFRFGSGFLNLGLHLRKEWNHNGHLGLNESYDLDFNVEPVWHLPFRIGGARLAFDGFADYNTPKGRDAAGRDTRAELLARPLLMIDVSPMIGLTSQVLELGVGFDYWHNMFGKDADRVPGASQFTPVFTLAVHLPLGAARH